jgi:hypothetical protein
MIQRIQSVFLLIAGLFFGGEFILPFATSNKPIPQYLSDLVYNIHDHPVLLTITILGIVVSLAAIFLYNNRSLQLKLTYLIIIFSIFLPLVAFLLIYNEGTAMAADAVIDDNFGAFLPIGSLIFAVLASRAIRKDDKLVKSMDRLR